MSRTIVIGDLHGCHEETLQLLQKCKYAAGDRVVFLGDLVDRGPDNDKCVDLVRSIEQKQGSTACVLGNHEQKHLWYKKREAAGIDVTSMPASHVHTRSQLKEEHYDYFETLPLFLRLPEFNAACVHAGAFPNRSLEDQTANHLLHIQMINPAEGENSYWVSKSPKDYSFWVHYWNGDERLIFGHSVLDKPLISSHAVGIDGGAVFGLELHALILPEWEIVSVKGIKDWGKGSRGAQAKPIEKFLIYDDVSTFS